MTTRIAMSAPSAAGLKPPRLPLLVTLGLSSSEMSPRPSTSVRLVDLFVLSLPVAIGVAPPCATGSDLTVGQ